MPMPIALQLHCKGHGECSGHGEQVACANILHVQQTLTSLKRFAAVHPDAPRGLGAHTAPQIKRFNAFPTPADLIAVCRTAGVARIARKTPPGLHKYPWVYVLCCGFGFDCQCNLVENASLAESDLQHACLPHWVSQRRHSRASRCLESPLPLARFEVRFSQNWGMLLVSLVVLGWHVQSSSQERARPTGWDGHCSLSFRFCVCSLRQQVLQLCTAAAQANPFHQGTFSPQ